jgi:hypothetical protein
MVDTELPSQSPLGDATGRVEVADLINVLLSELRHPVVLASDPRLSTCGHLIVCVFLRGADPKVTWTAARRVVADVVPDLKELGWNDEARKFKSNVMSRLHPAVEPDMAVSGLVPVAGERPAPVGRRSPIYLLPEPLSRILARLNTGAVAPNEAL